MSSVVVREVAGQRLAAVQAAAEQAKQAWSNLHRHLDRTPNGGAVQVEVDRMEAGAVARFEGQMERLLAAHAGEVVGLEGESLTAAMFDAYFAGSAPFGGGSKKSEFPDAAALLSLDAVASARDTYVLAVSQDDGWHEYCASSRRVYCLRKLTDLAGLFRSTGPEAQALLSALSAYLRDPRVVHELGLTAVIREGLRNVVVSTVMPSRASAVADAMVTEVRLTGFQIEADAVGIWLTSAPAGQGAAEVSVECSVELGLSFYDPRQTRARGSAGSRFEDRAAYVVRALPLNLALELDGLSPKPEFPQAIAKVSLVPQEYKLRLSDDEVPSHYWPFSYSWDDLDDIPF